MSSTSTTEADNVARGLSSDLHRCLEAGELCDCVLVRHTSPKEVQDEEEATDKVAMSSFLLAARSPMMNRMLLGEFKESKEKVIHVRGMDKETFELFINYIFGKAPALDDFNQTVQLYKGAHYYRMEELQSLCLNVLVKKVDWKNVCQLADIAAVYDNETLRTAVINCFTNDMRLFQYSDGYNALLTKHPDYVFNLFSDIVLGIRKERAVIIGGSCEDGKKSNSIWALDFSTDSVIVWKSLRIATSGHVVGKYERKVIVCGGHTDGGVTTNRVEIFSNDTEDSIETPPMNVRRACAGGAVCGDYFYVCGGKDTNNVPQNSCERYSFEANKWEYLEQNMPKALSGCSVVSHSPYLYVIGGEYNDTYCNSLFRYDTKTGQWNSMAPMSKTRSSAGCALLEKGSIIFVSGGRDGGNSTNACEKFSVASNSWSAAASMNCKRCSHALVPWHSDDVLVIGGNASVNMDDSIEQLNGTSKTWEAMTWKLPQKLKDFAVVLY